MNVLSGIFMFLVLIGEMPTAQATSDIVDFDRYKIILDRKPFGEITMGNTSENVDVANLKPLSSVMQLVALERDDFSGKERAGLVDSAGKTSFYLAVGDEENGCLLVKVDFQGDRALLRKGTQEEWISLGDSKRGSSDQSRDRSLDDKGRESSMRMNAEHKRNKSPSISSVTAIPPTNQASQVHWESREEMKNFYRKRNMQFIRSGMPPLPMALTPEDDAQLVKEGVLPPVESVRK